MSKPTLLLINKFHHDVGRAGGVGRYVLQEEAELTARGWTVVPFATLDEHALDTPWRRYFPRSRDYSTARHELSALGDACSLVWNREAARCLEALLATVRPDVVHLHNIYHHLSPSILEVLRRHRLPTVMTLHDLRLLCPAIHMLRRGELCEDCRGGRFLAAVRGRCVKDSTAASALAALETWHHTRRGLYPGAVRRFLCPSAFLRRKYIEWGWRESSLEHLPNFVDVDAFTPADAPPDDACLYFGRLSREKGVHTLLTAYALWTARREKAREPFPPVLRIAGSGPDEALLRAEAGRLGPARVEFLGPLSPSDLRTVLRAARFTILPSECYENGSLSLLESLACGVPVVGSDLGGIPEHLQDGVTGVLFAAGDAESLADALARADALPISSQTAARAVAVSHYGRGRHMDRLETILQDAAAG